MKNSTLLAEALKMLYVQSMLLGHYPLRADETSVLSEGLIHLIDAAMDNSNSNGQGDFGD